MKHKNIKYHKVETSKSLEPQIKEIKEERIEKRLEPTVNEETLKTITPVERSKTDNVTEATPIKEMHAEIASATAELARKHPVVEPQKANASLMVPIAIIIAGVLIAGAIIFTASKTPAVPKSPEFQSVTSQLTKGTIAEEVGLNKKDFATCLASGKYTASIKEVSDAGAKAGIQGTPYSVMITASGKKFVINGAQPIADVKAKIELALKGDTKDAVEVNIPPVTEKDFIVGNPNAEIKIVEYSDTECPFSKRFHQTMLDIMKEYEAGGKVAWVYRYFPLDGLHQKARHEAEAVACAAEQGGNTKFWEYLDLLFKITPSNDGLDSSLL
jgi:protein-disulfide isomerase